jgi:hypothetical protein
VRQPFLSLPSAWFVSEPTEMFTDILQIHNTLLGGGGYIFCPCRFSEVFLKIITVSGEAHRQTLYLMDEFSPYEKYFSFKFHLNVTITSTKLEPQFSD